MKFIKEIAQRVKQQFDEADLQFCGFRWYYQYHIEPTRQFAKSLARKYGANETVVELAALFHDVGLIGKGRDLHETRSTNEAEKILLEFKINSELIFSVRECILHNTKTIEGKIFETADAMAHLSGPHFFIKAITHKNFEDFRTWALQKIGTDLNRIFFADEKVWAKKRAGVLLEMLSYENQYK